MDISYKLIIYILLGTCNLSYLVAQNSDSLSYLSRDFYRAYNIDETQKDKESKYRMWNVYTQKFDSIYDIKPDEFVYARIDSINPIELSSEQIESIHFCTLEDRKKLNQYFKIDSLLSVKKLSLEGRANKRDYYNYHKNFYIIEKKGNKFFKIKVILRNRIMF